MAIIDLTNSVWGGQCAIAHPSRRVIYAGPLPTTAPDAVTSTSLAAAVRASLAPQLARLDVPVSSRSTLQAGEIPAGLTAEQAQQLLSLAAIHGLVPGVPLVVTASSRSAGGVQQSITEASGVVTVERVA